MYAPIAELHAHLVFKNEMKLNETEDFDLRQEDSVVYGSQEPVSNSANRPKWGTRWILALPVVDRS